MPIVRGHQAASLIKEAVVLDLSDVSRQAEKIINQARAQSQQIIADARAQADALLAAGDEKGYADGHARGVQEGHAEGLEQGRAEAFEAHSAALQAIEDAWNAAGVQWDQHMEQVHRDARDAVLEVALRLSEKIIHRVIEIDDTVALDQIRHALSYVLSPLDVVVKISPEDRDLVSAALPRLSQEFAHLGHVSLQNDANISKGGCVVTYGTGRIDASLETQLTRIVVRMFPDDVDVERNVLEPLDAAETDGNAEMHVDEEPFDTGTETLTDAESVVDAADAAAADAMLDLQQATQSPDDDATDDADAVAVNEIDQASDPDSDIDVATDFDSDSDADFDFDADEPDTPGTPSP